MVMSSSDAGPTPAPPGVTGAKGSKLKTCKVEGTDKDPEGAESVQSDLVGAGTESDSRALTALTLGTLSGHSRPHLQVPSLRR